MNRLFALVGLTVALAACGDKSAPPPQNGDGRGAEGEVLGGTISDAMLPLDTVRSQSPHMPEEGAQAGSTSTGTADGEEAAPTDTGVSDSGAADDTSDAGDTGEPREE